MKKRLSRWQRVVDGILNVVGFGSDRSRRSSPPQQRRLEVEQLEDRSVPSISGLFYTDSNNHLFLRDNTTNQVTDTGGFAVKLAGGLDAAGNPEAFFTDGNNELWRFDNGTFTNTGAFARQLSAGRGFAAFTDGNNELWTLSDQSGFHNTGGFATQLSAAGDNAGNNFVAFLDGGNHLFTLNATTNAFTNTGAFATRLAAGTDALGNPEVFFTDGNNQLFRLDNGTFTNTGAFATRISAGQGVVAFTDGNNQVWTFSDQTGFHNSGAFAISLTTSVDTMGNTTVTFLDGNSHMWTLNAATNVVTDTGIDNVRPTPDANAPTGNGFDTSSNDGVVVDPNPIPPVDPGTDPGVVDIPGTDDTCDPPVITTDPCPTDTSDPIDTSSPPDTSPPADGGFTDPGFDPGFGV